MAWIKILGIARKAIAATLIVALAAAEPRYAPPNRKAATCFGAQPARSQRPGLILVYTQM